MGLKNLFVFLFKKIKTPLLRLFFKIWCFLLRPLLLIILKFGLWLKKLSKNISDPAQGNLIAIFSNRYVIHVIIIILAVFTTFNNIKAKEIREETFGQKSIVYQMVSKIDLGYLASREANEIIIEESSLLNAANEEKSGNNRILGYLDEGVGLKSQIQPQEIVLKEIIEEESEIATSQGSSALIKPQISNTAEIIKKRNRPTEYMVQEGDTVYTIAQKFGVSTNTILWENNLSSRSYIRPGDKLTILPESGVSHKIKRGDTISSLAKKYDVEEKEIIAANQLANGADIYVGQKLIIPGGRPYSIPVLARPATNLSSLKNIFIPPSSPRSSGGRMIWPTAWRTITQYFSWRHSGLDIDGNYNTPIYAANDGVVVISGWNNGGYGLQIVIDHGGGVKTRYAHNSKNFVSVGQRVSQGQTIGMVGTTGRSTGTHLHFEILINGRRANPLSYIK